MFERTIIRRKADRLAITVAIAVLAGCATSAPAVNETLDPLTAVTITSSSKPLVLYRDEPSRAAYARSYLHLGPIQINRSGDFKYFLRVGIWNTMHTADVTENRDGFDSIVLFVDGEPLPLDAAGWTPASIGASEPVYVKPVAASVDAYYRVTTDQIRLIAQSNDFRLQTTGSSPRDFEMWDWQTAAKDALQAFLEQVFL